MPQQDHYRKPKQGTTDYSRRIAAAVDDEGWQKFRISMKGCSTTLKLNMLQAYYVDHYVRAPDPDTVPPDQWEALKLELEDVRIRVDNYIKALSRGGQLYPGESLETMLACNWRPRVKRN